MASENVNVGWGEKIQVWKGWCLQKERQQRRQEHKGSAFGKAGGQKGGLGRGCEWKGKMGAQRHGFAQALLSKGSASQNSGKSEIG